MYGIVKSVQKNFGYITNPSFGTVQPALKRLESNGCIKSDKFFTDGGKPYLYYNITSKGKEVLIKNIKSRLPKNPIQLVSEIRLRLSYLDILNSEERSEVCKILKTSLIALKNKAEEIQNSNSQKDMPSARMVLDNTLCEYKNLYNLIESLGK